VLNNCFGMYKKIYHIFKRKAIFFIKSTEHLRIIFHNGDKCSGFVSREFEYNDEAIGLLSNLQSRGENSDKLNKLLTGER